MYLKYHKAGLTPTTPVTSTAISPVKMSKGRGRGGGGGVVMVYCFVQNIFFGQHESQNNYLFCRAKREFFFQNLTLNQIIIFSSSKIRIFSPAKLGIRISFQKKNIPPPPPWKLNGASLNELNCDFSNFSNVNLAYDNFNHQFTEVYDKHVPLKKRSILKSPGPVFIKPLKLRFS